jgi:hypothetical protein
MRQSLIVILAVCYATVNVVLAGDKTIPGVVSVDVSGNSGKIKIYPNGDNSNFIQITQSKVEELDVNGNSVNQRSINLASSISDAAWSDPVTVTTSNGIVYTQVWFTSTFPVPAVAGSAVFFRVTCRLYQNRTTLTNGNQQVAIYQNSLKFDVNITGWPTFAVSNNTLNYEITMASKGQDTGGKIENKGPKEKKVLFSNGVMDMPEYANIDGAPNTPISVTLSSKGNKDTVAFAFPQGKSILYDPVMCLGSCDGDAGAGAAFAPSLLLVAALSVASLLLIR